MNPYSFERHSDSWATISSSGDVQINAILRRGDTKKNLATCDDSAYGASSFAQSPVQEVGDEPGELNR